LHFENWYQHTEMLLYANNGSRVLLFQIRVTSMKRTVWVGIVSRRPA
jgi:hypothetical protein